MRRWSLVCLGLLLGSAVSAFDAGVLELRSDPGLEVVWEGTVLGVTDSEGRMEISRIPPGAYEIELRGAGRRGRSVVVEIAVGRNAFVDPRSAAAPGSARAGGALSSRVGGTGDGVDGTSPAPEDEGVEAIAPGTAQLDASARGVPSSPLLIAIAVAAVFALLVYFRDPRHFRRGVAPAAGASRGIHRSGDGGSAFSGSSFDSGAARRVIEVVGIEISRVEKPGGEG